MPASPSAAARGRESGGEDCRMVLAYWTDKGGTLGVRIGGVAPRHYEHGR